MKLLPLVPKEEERVESSEDKSPLIRVCPYTHAFAKHWMHECTHKQTRARAGKHRHIRARAREHIRTHTYTHTHTHPYAHTHKYACVHTPTHARARMRVRAHGRTYTRIRTPSERTTGRSALGPMLSPARGKYWQPVTMVTEVSY